jgi:hypothetical protein
MDKAIQQVRTIINQPVAQIRRDSTMRVSTYNPGWFHNGANKPDFNHVDVRTTQETPYSAHEYVTSDLNPGVVFHGQDLEFNANTKYFYTDRTLPKKKLTEAEMVEINRLYRVIGHCEQELSRPQTPEPNSDSSSTQNSPSTQVIPSTSGSPVHCNPPSYCGPSIRDGYFCVS